MRRELLGRGQLLAGESSAGGTFSSGSQRRRAADSAAAREDSESGASHAAISVCAWRQVRVVMPREYPARSSGLERLGRLQP
jgi:hypothetical protein